MDRLRTGTTSWLGRAGEVEPPFLVLPLTVEPTKPRLCHDARFLNLWMEDNPFTLHTLNDLPRYITKDSYQTVLDDKSGYDHILLLEDSRTFCGIQWGGWYFTYQLSKQRFIGPFLPLKYGEKFIEFKSTCKCLGVTIDSNLSWQEHTKSLLKSFNKKMAVLRTIKFLPSSILQTIYFRTVLPSVLYGILVWGSCSPALIDDLERAHIRAYKLIRNSKADQLNKLKDWNNLSLFYTQRLLVEAYKSY